MPKRKVISESEKVPVKKLKSDSKPALKEFVSKLSFESSEQCLRSLIYPTTLEDFLAKYWEKEPLFVERKDDEYFKDFPTKVKLEELAKKENLIWDKNLFLSQDEKGTETLEAEGRATVKSIHKYFKEKLTVMFSNPHRFHRELYQLLLSLEEYFGCSVNCCLDVHTEGAFNLKPGYIGREEFILQIEGKKQWTLFKPIQQLAFLDSEDLSQDNIGKETHEFVLEAGDLLYFPRGTVFQAHSVPGEVSSHISIEFYAECTWGHFLSNIFDKAVNEALEKDLAFREGLPINFLSYMGFGKHKLNNDMIGKQKTDRTPKDIVPQLSKVELDNQKLFKEKLEKIFVLLVPYLDAHRGADTVFGKTFMLERLAPTQEEERPSETEQPPTEESLVQMIHPKHIRIIYHDPDESSSDEDDDINSIEDENDDDDMDDEGEKEEKSPEKESKKSQKDSKKEKKSQKSNVKGKDSKKEKKSQKSEIKEKEGKDAGKDDDDDEMASDNDDELDKSFRNEPCIVLYHSLNNKVEPDEDDEEDLDDSENEKESNKVKFPLHFYDALLVLHRSASPVAVADLPLTSEECVELTVTLWCEGLLKVVEKS